MRCVDADGLMLSFAGGDETQALQRGIESLVFPVGIVRHMDAMMEPGRIGHLMKPSFGDGTFREPARKIARSAVFENVIQAKMTWRYG